LPPNVQDTVAKLYDLHNAEIGKTKALRFANLFVLTPLKNQELAEVVQEYLEMKIHLKVRNIFSESGPTSSTVRFPISKLMKMKFNE